MKYMIHITLSPDSFTDRVSRFLETGAPPPEGATMLGRWHALGLDSVFILAETDDPASIYRWLAEWSDLLEFEVFPVIEDEAAAAVLASL